MDDDVLNSYIAALDDENPDVRINAINNLGDSGDELCLNELRKRLKDLTPEHQALIIAVGKLKRALGIR